jgi:uncharacterized protein YndB with AHSA1/START domain
MTNQRTVTAEPGDQSISFSREFEAPAQRVFEAHVVPDLVAQWTGPRGTHVTIREFDARTGGCWSYVVVGSDREWAFHGSFHEVTAPRRIVQTWEYDDEPGHPTLEVFTFVDLPEGAQSHRRPDGLPVGRGSRRESGRWVRQREERRFRASGPASRTGARHELTRDSASGAQAA